MKKTNCFLFARYSELLFVIFPKIEVLFELHSEDKKLISLCLDWCIDESIKNTLLLNIQQKAYHPFFSVIYSKIRFDIDRYTRSIISMSETLQFGENSVITYCDGIDIFITSTTNDQ